MTISRTPLGQGYCQLLVQSPCQPASLRKRSVAAFSARPSMQSSPGSLAGCVFVAVLAKCFPVRGCVCRRTNGGGGERQGRRDLRYPTALVRAGKHNLLTKIPLQSGRTAGNGARSPGLTSRRAPRMRSFATNGSVATTSEPGTSKPSSGRRGSR